MTSRGTVLLVATATLLLSIRPAAAQPVARPITTYVRVPPNPDGAIAGMQEEMLMSHEDAAWIIFLNRTGGTFDPGWPDDSRINRSSVLQSTLGRSATLGPYPYGDSSWNTLMTCVRDLYADFDVYVTDEDPGDTPHMETVVSGHPNDIGLPRGVGGIAPAGCEPIPNSVQYVFPETYGPGAMQGMCEAVGQETAHSFGLDHEFLCEDVMTYLQTCPDNKTFVDQFTRCGEFNPRNCFCGNREQNSYQHLLEWAGPHPEINPPTVSITSPEDGTTVPQRFPILVDATDDSMVESVQIFIDDEHVETANEAPYEFTAPDGLEDGEHTVEARAFDDEGARATDSITVTVTSEDGEECATSRDCDDGEECVDGFCLPDDPDGGGDGDADGDGSGLVGFRGGGCTVAGAPQLVGLVLVLLGLAFRRRCRR